MGCRLPRKLSSDRATGIVGAASALNKFWDITNHGAGIVYLPKPGGTLRLQDHSKNWRSEQRRSIGPGPACSSRLAGIIMRHLMRSQSRLSVSPSALSSVRQLLADVPAGLEKNFAGERSISLDLLRNRVPSCTAIGCVGNRRGERLGTGFLVAGELLRTTWGTAPVFITNAHVIGTEVANARSPRMTRW